MVFRAQGESPASCAGERGLNPAAPMLQRETARSAAETKHILKKRILGITEAGAGFRAGAGIGFRIPLTGGHQIRADAFPKKMSDELLKYALGFTWIITLPAYGLVVITFLWPEQFSGSRARAIFCRGAGRARKYHLLSGASREQAATWPLAVEPHKNYHLGTLTGV